VLDPDIDQLEAVDIVESGKEFSRLLWEVSHRILDPATGNTVISERTDVVEEVDFGSREGDAVHPSRVVPVVDRNR